MSKNFLGTGLCFPLKVDRNGGVVLSSLEDNIEQSVRIILGTALGERVMRPNFGSAIHDYVFSPNNPTTAGKVEFYTSEALIKWEPRIMDVEVHAQRDPMRENILNVHVNYKIKATNSRHNLVYPFYLRREDTL